MHFSNKPPPAFYPIIIIIATSGFGRKDIVEYLIQYGAKVDAQDDGRQTLYFTCHMTFT